MLQNCETDSVSIYSFFFRTFFWRIFNANFSLKYILVHLKQCFPNYFLLPPSLTQWSAMGGLKVEHFFFFNFFNFYTNLDISTPFSVMERINKILSHKRVQIPHGLKIFVFQLIVTFKQIGMSVYEIFSYGIGTAISLIVL